MQKFSEQAVITKWLYQEGQWSWSAIQPFIEWVQKLGWDSARQAIQNYSAEQLAVEWGWQEAGISLSKQSQYIHWLREQGKDFSVRSIHQWQEKQMAGEWYWCTPYDEVYPRMLTSLEEVPPVLWCSQSSLAEFFQKPALAVVGSRRMSNYGRLATEDFVRSFVQNFSIPIISGGAYGIDSVAHDTCLRFGGKTIAFLAHGCRQLPRRLQAWLDEPNFLAMTEFPPDMPVERWHYVQRNRLIAGAAAAVVVIEAAQKSGTMLTAAAAFLQGKEVFVVTQPRQSRNVAGIRALLENGAHLVATPEDLWQYLVPQDTATSTTIKKEKITSIWHTPLELEILQILQENNGSLLASACRQKVSASLRNPSDWPQAVLALELRGVLKQNCGVLSFMRSHT